MSNKASIDADNPEWTEEDFRHAKPAAQLPAGLMAFFPKTRGTKKPQGFELLSFANLAKLLRSKSPI